MRATLIGHPPVEDSEPGLSGVVPVSLTDSENCEGSAITRSTEPSGACSRIPSMQSSFQTVTQSAPCETFRYAALGDTTRVAVPDA